MQSGTTTAIPCQFGSLPYVTATINHVHVARSIKGLNYTDLHPHSKTTVTITVSTTSKPGLAAGNRYFPQRRIF